MKRQRSFGEVVLIALVPFIFVLMMGAPWFAAIAYLFLFEDASKPRGPQGPAPIGSFELRREWGEKNFKEHLAAAEKWIREDGNIKSNIGEVVRVAPIGGPNKYCEAFPYYHWKLNLQVVGEKGEGVMRFSKVGNVGFKDDPHIVPDPINPWRLTVSKRSD